MSQIKAVTESPRSLTWKARGLICEELDYNKVLYSRTNRQIEQESF